MESYQYYILLIIGLYFLIRQYINSKNDFFLQDAEFLKQARIDLLSRLKNLGRSDKDISEYLEAYDFFSLKSNGNKFDGATILRDLFIIKYNIPKVRLPATACLHDFDFIQGANRNPIKMWKANNKYFKNLEANGHGTHYVRLIALQFLAITLIYPFVQFIIYQAKSTPKN